MKTFGTNLKNARKELQMNQQALGDAIGVGQTTIANYEKGLRFPTGDLLKKIAEILNVSIDVLLSHEVLSRHQLEPDFDMVQYQKRFLAHLLNGEEQKAIVMVWDLQPTVDNLVMIYEELLMTTMYDVGRLWEVGSLSIASEHYTSHVVHKIIAMLSTIPATVPKINKSALCMSMSPESHTIGIKMISEYLNLLGIQSYYVGTNIPSGSLADMLIKKKIDIIAISITLATHMDHLGHLVKVIKSHPGLKNIRIVVGGQGLVHQEALLASIAIDGIASDFGTLKQWLEEMNMV